MLRFYMDHQVHVAITAGLRRRGVDCVTLHDDGAMAADEMKNAVPQIPL